MTLQLLGDRYRIIRVLGRGGFGETFLAEDTQMPSGRRCVIKQLKPIVNNPQIYQLVQERFGREAAILEELGGASAQIPALYAYFQASGQFYLVQEWVEGETLTALRSQGMMSESAVREILLSLLPVLDYVHSKRIIHRDIKPDNIILRGDGKPVLIDFGAVREIMGTVVNSQGNATSSIVIGTPGYMPSEQAAGRPVYSSDLYSLGMTAIYLLTGRSPQQLETDSQTGEVVWRQFALNISPTFAGILDRAIAYHPRDRYPTALSMLDALRKDAPIAPTLPFHRQPVAPTIPPAVSVSPAPTARDRGPNKILMSGLIAGGLIGALAVAVINKSPQPITPPITSITPEPVISPAANVPIIAPTIANRTTAPLPLATSPSASKAVPLVTPTPVKSNTAPETIPTPILNVHTDDYGFVSTRQVTNADLDSKDGLQLDIMRNWVFASHGRRFESPVLQNYFNKQRWYRPQYSPKDFPEKLLSSLEQQNIKYIAMYQDQHNRRYVKK